MSAFKIMVILAIFTVFSLLWKIMFRKKRHQWYIRRAKEVYRRINDNRNEYTDAQLLNYLRHINPYVFEELLLLAFEQKGLKVVRNKRYSGDGGIDGHILVDKHKIPIQAKRYSGYIHKQDVVRFSRIVERKKVQFGYFIHTGKTGLLGGDPSSSTVRIISGQRLVSLMDKSTPLFNLYI